MIAGLKILVVSVLGLSPLISQMLTGKGKGIAAPTVSIYDAAPNTEWRPPARTPAPL